MLNLFIFTFFTLWLQRFTRKSRISGGSFLLVIREQILPTQIKNLQHGSVKLPACFWGKDSGNVTLFISLLDKLSVDVPRDARLVWYLSLLFEQPVFVLHAFMGYTCSRSPLCVSTHFRDQYFL